MTDRIRRTLVAAAVLAFFPMTVKGDAALGHANRLAKESSPYLLQHQHNPVDWYPWGDEAFEKARREEKSIFLSIGYSTCHWCHVMERESFESEEIAALLNRDFVSIKVDREERPDLDNVYMTACQLLTRSGGWPLTVILTPKGLPFFAGTYFPPADTHGRTGMRTLLPRLAEFWRTHRREAEAQADEVAVAVRHAIAAPPKENAAPLDAAFFRSLEDDLARRFDPAHGGFSDAPKFPPHGALDYLLKAGPGRPEAMLRKTLDGMQDGGLFDHVGGGFHRYSVDAEWFIPHFEKMLYDNAQLLAVYAAAARRFGDRRYRDTANRIVAWLEREMTTPEGAYASALDADSEGVEGRYYLWAADEIDATLGTAQAPLYRKAFGIERAGNTPPAFAEGRGKNLPRRVVSLADLARQVDGGAAEIEARLAADQEALERVRARRVHPARDDKVLTAWNALAVSALARASRDLGEPRLLSIAERIARFLISIHVSDDRVWHGSRAGKPKIEGFLEDYAFLADALVELSEASGDRSYSEIARRLSREMIRRFADLGAGGFFQTAAPVSGERDFLDLAKEYLDEVVPSPNGIAAEVLRRLDTLDPSPEFRAAAERTIASGAGYGRAFPSAATTLASLAERNSAAPGPRSSSATSGPVRVSLSAKVEDAGGPKIDVRFAIEPGWHVQSHEPTRKDLVATRVAPRPDARWRFSDPLYPAARTTRVAGEELSVYSGDFVVTTPVSRVDESDAEPTGVVDVEFQACDNSRCLAPVRIELEIPATGRR
jgi:uncharacterized protein YyaL (SSP411 family)